MREATSRRPAVRRPRSALPGAALLAAVLLAAPSATVAQDFRRAEFYFHKGVTAMESGQFTRAMDAFLRARAASSASPMPEVYIGHVAMAQGDFYAAERSYLRAIQLARDLEGAEQRAAIHQAAEQAEALDRYILSSTHGVGGAGGPLAVQQAIIERQKREGTTRGLGFCLRALSGEDRVPANLYVYLGNARLRGGNMTEAIEAYREAVKRAPAAPEPYHNLAVALAQAGRLAEALEACARAEALDYAPATVLHAQIDRLLGARATSRTQ
jgi:tetratricopeptide (TPR) repeat protein